VRAGSGPPWGPDVLVGADINGATLGIVGLGRIGLALARRARGFNMRILYTDPQRQPDFEDELDLVRVSFNELLERSDFISIHTYLSAETRHLFGPDAFARMLPNAILINTSRGPVVDSEALIAALQQKKIAGAALDVFDPEPIPPDSPLLRMRNVVITPHIASASGHARRQMALISVENLIAGLTGERLPYCANPQVYH
jgi:glyoxylate reductase